MAVLPWEAILTVGIWRGPGSVAQGAVGAPTLEVPKARLDEPRAA